MNSWTDQQLLRDYAERSSETAFAELVRRHVDFVYSVAVRMVCDTHLAQDVTQGVFVALAQSAGRLVEHPVLSGWLHRTTRNLAANTVRSETRRRIREQEAAAMNQLQESDATWEIIAPYLDEALGELADEDRDALLLRYFERKSGREMADILGTSEDAAKKRLSRAAERLREIFSKRRLAIGAGGLMALISANAVQAAPLGLAASISSAAALAGTAVQTSTVIATTKTIAMTTLQKSIIVAALVTATGTGIYAAHQNEKMGSEIQTLQQQLAPLTAQIQGLQQERDDATNQLADLLAENARHESNSNESELLKLRGEVTRLENSKTQEDDDPTTSAATALVARVNRLKQWLNQHPNEKIPELQLLKAQEWLRELSFFGDMNTDEDCNYAASQLRSSAKQTFAQLLGRALDRYIADNNGQLPSDISQLESYFKKPVDDAILQRYQVLQTGNLNDVPADAPIIGEKTPVDEQNDTLFTISTTGYSYHSTGTSLSSGSGTGGFGTNITAQVKPFQKQN